MVSWLTGLTFGEPIRCYKTNQSYQGMVSNPIYFIALMTPLVAGRSSAGPCVLWSLCCDSPSLLYACGGTEVGRLALRRVCCSAVFASTIAAHRKMMNIYWHYPSRKININEKCCRIITGLQKKKSRSSPTHSLRIIRIEFREFHPHRRSTKS